MKIFSKSSISRVFAAVKVSLCIRLKTSNLYLRVIWVDRKRKSATRRWRKEKHELEGGVKEKHELEGGVKEKHELEGGVKE